MAWALICKSRLGPILESDYEGNDQYTFLGHTSTNMYMQLQKQTGRNFYSNVILSKTFNALFCIRGSFMTVANWGGLEPCFTKMHHKKHPIVTSKKAFSRNVLTNTNTYCWHVPYCFSLNEYQYHITHSATVTWKI